MFPISAFVACGMEHCVANMFFIPLGILIRDWSPSGFWSAVKQAPGDYADLNWNNFLIANLLPVTLGNIVGGALMVGVVYWFVYLRGRSKWAQ